MKNKLVKYKLSNEKTLRVIKMLHKNIYNSVDHPNDIKYNATKRGLELMIDKFTINLEKLKGNNIPWKMKYPINNSTLIITCDKKGKITSKLSVI